MDLGVHASIRLGYQRAVEEARALGCRAIQIFCYRRHHVEPDPAELKLFRDCLEELGVRLLVHVRYVPSLASSDPKRRAHSAGWLARELRLSCALGAEALVVHAGAYSEGGDADAGMSFFVDGARRARDLAKASLPLLVENVPGGGRRMGGTLEEIGELGERLMREDFEVGYCLDTAHAFAQGYEVGSEGGMRAFLDSATR